MKKGFSLVDVLITLFVASTFSLAILGGLSLNLKSVRLTNDKMLAASIAQSRVEQLRNMSYDDLSTENGSIIPQGSIKDEETVSIENKQYKLTTYIAYFDDPFDGCFQEVDVNSSKCADDTIVPKPKDPYPYDYKKVTVKVFRINTSFLLTELSTNVASHAAETPTNTGILAISVTDAGGNNVSDATITVVQEGTGLIPPPTYSALSTTDNFTLFPLLPPAINLYHITVSKAGYNSDGTIPVSLENPNPLKSDATIIAQQVTTMHFAIDKLGSLNLASKDLGGNPLPNQNLTIVSEKTLDINGLIPKYIYDISTNGEGNYELANLEWGKYSIQTSSGTFIIKAEPYQPINIAPETATSSVIFISSDANLIRIQTISPQTTLTGGLITMTITGANLTDTTTAVLEKTDQTPITGTNWIITPDSNGTEASVDFDLTGAGIGIWNLKLTKGLEILIQNEAIIINAQ